MVLLARVEASIWGSQQAAGLAGHKLVVLRPCSAATTDHALENAPTANIVAVDQLGASVGQMVLVTRSSRCRDLTVGATFPGKDVVIAIVDVAQIGAQELT